MFNPQQMAALDRHVHCAVVANAGSGKTSVLVERFIRILLLESVRLDQVVAITFTRAAAAEMRQRLHEKIHSILSLPDEQAPYLEHISPEVLASRLHTLSVQIGTARISTFHSFCAGLVRQYADVVGRSSDVRDADSRLTDELCAEAIDTAMKGLLGPTGINDPDMQEMFEALTPSAVQSHVARLARNSSQRREFIGSCSGPADDFLERRRVMVLPLQIDAAAEFALRLCNHVRGYVDAIPPLEELCASLEGLARRLAAGDASALPELSGLYQEWFAASTRTVRAKKIPAAFKSVEPPSPFPSELGLNLSIISETWSADMELREIRVVRALARLAEAASSEYARLKLRRNVIDFDDMIDDAMRLLENEEIAEAIRRSITYIMIDEFQDTDPTQYALLERLVPALTGSAVAGPNVYVVGDDKQSIYGFRDADVRLFRRARRAIRRANDLADSGDSGIRPLSVSYRMHQTLVDHVNGICRSAFSRVETPDDDDDDSYDVAYLDLEAGIVREESESLSSVQIVTVDAESLKGQQEFARVAHQISAILSGSSDVWVFDKEVERRRPRAGDIAVLVPRNADKGPIADELRRRGIPFRVYGGRAFFSRPEVADVRAALTAAVDPLDDLATAVAMRSMILRCGDSDIVAASLLGRASSLQDGLQTLAASEGASVESIAASAFFSWLRTMLSLHPVSQVIEPMLQRCGWYEAMRHEPRAEQMMANIEKLIALCADQEQSQSASIADVLDAISVPDDDLESEEVVLSDDDAVHIMTIHGSKGLEFPIVALAGLNTVYRPSSILSSHQLGPTLTLPNERVDPLDVLSKVSLPFVLSHALNKLLVRRREEAQSRRLLYVALTRAKAHLILALPTFETASSATGLLSILVDAVGRRGPWSESCVPAREEVAATVREERMASPLPDVIAEALEPPRPDLVTASTISRFHSAGAFTPPLRRTISTETSSTAYGSAVHAALAAVLRNGHEPGSSEITKCIIEVLAGCELDRREALRAHDEIIAVLTSDLVAGRRADLSSAVIEGSVFALHGHTVVEGVLDVRLATADGVVEVWDWKTNAVRSEENLTALSEHYRAQMQTYAWLCAQAVGGCSQVITRLVFTKAVVAGMPAVDAVQTWQAGELTLPEF